MPENLLHEIVTVNVSADGPPLSRASFSQPIIVGQHTRFGERLRAYTALEGMEADGFQPSDAEYIEAAALLAQRSVHGRRIGPFLIGRRAAPVAQVDTLTAVYDAAGQYTIEFTSPGSAPVTIGPVAAVTDAAGSAAALVAAFNGSAAGGVATAAATSGGSFTVTADVPGVAFALALTASGGAAALTRVATTPNTGIAEDLAAIEAAGNTAWATILTNRVRSTLAQAAAWIESAARRQFLLAQANDAAVIAAGYDAGNIYTDVLSELRGRGYRRTAFWWHALNAEALAAGVAGRVLPFRPGMVSWQHKDVVGMTADVLTAAQRGHLIGTPQAPTSTKRGNIYVPLTAEANSLFRGFTVGGQRIEFVRYVDYLENAVQTAVASHFLSKPKVDLTDTGIAEVANVVAAVLQAETGDGLPIASFSPPQGPPAASLSANDRAAGYLSEPITSEVQLSGELGHAVIDLAVRA